MATSGRRGCEADWRRCWRSRTFPAIGPAARARYQDFVEGFAPLLRGGREFAEAGEELPDEVVMLAVGAAEAIVFEEIEAGRAAQLPALGPAAGAARAVIAQLTSNRASVVLTVT